MYIKTTDGRSLGDILGSALLRTDADRMMKAHGYVRLVGPKCTPPQHVPSLLEANNISPRYNVENYSNAVAAYIAGDIGETEMYRRMRVG